MFGIGAPELIFILLLALLIFGPKRLPQLGRTLGKGMAEFRKASTELQRAFNTDLMPPEETPAQRYAKRTVALATPPATEEVATPATVETPIGVLDGEEVAVPVTTAAAAPGEEPPSGGTP